MNTRKMIFYVPFLAVTFVAALLLWNEHRSDPSITILEEETPPQTSSLAPDPRLEEASRQNPDTVAWLTIPGTSIDGPVLQSVDNDYYLRRNELGETDYRGCLYADYEAKLTSANDISRNTVLYGHTFTDGYTGGFFDLAQYQDNEWANQHQEIFLSVADAMLKFKVVSAGIACTDEGTLPIYCNVNDKEFAEIVALAEQRNVIDLDGGAFEDADHLLTLATCTDDPSERLVVVCRLEVEEGA